MFGEATTGGSGSARVALAHDYLTQRGGAERVVVMMAEAFPDAPLHTLLHEPDATFDEFRAIDVRASGLNRWWLLRKDHRLALPLLARAAAGVRVDADVLLASSSGWAHAMGCTGRKVVYCHAPARWLYQRELYLGPRGGSAAHRARRALAAGALGLLSRRLRAWDARQALSADRYLVNSNIIRDAVREAYGIEAEVVPPPPAMGPDGPMAPLPGVEFPYVLCVARLLPYKNVDAAIAAVRGLDGLGLVVVGKGPDRARLEALADGDPRVRFCLEASEETLRWLYAHAEALVACSHEDYGLTPLEAASFGRPTVALGAGGYLDTIDPGVNGVFLDDPAPATIRAGVDEALRRDWDEAAIRAHADRFGRARFVDRLRQAVAEIA